MNAHDLLATLLHRVAPDVDLDALGRDDILQEAADLDSMDFLNLLTALHDLTGVDVPESDYQCPALAGRTCRRRGRRRRRALSRRG